MLLDGGLGGSQRATSDGVPSGGSVAAGIGFMLAGVSLFPLMNTFAKSLTADYPLWQVTWARFLGHLLIISAVFMPRRGLALFRTAAPRRQLVRSLRKLPQTGDR